MWGSRYVLGVVVSLMAGMHHKQQAEQPEQGTNTPLFDVFILSGQSNMAGRGGVINKLSQANGTWYKAWDGVVPHESWFVPGSILRLHADLAWIDASEPLHSDIDTGKVCGIGPGLTFAAAVNNHGEAKASRKIGLVPCAKGATSITEWRRGGFLYNRMLHRSRDAISSGGILRCLLWYQGESDTLSPELAGNYKSELETFIRDVRSDLGLPDLPFIQVGITAKNHPHPELLRQVREAQRAIKMEGVFYVDAEGLELQEDGVHLTTPSQVQLGMKLAESFISNVVQSS